MIGDAVSLESSGKKTYQTKLKHPEVEVKFKWVDDALGALIVALGESRIAAEGHHESVKSHSGKDQKGD